MYESQAFSFLKAKNSLLTQDNITLRQYIATLRNERIQIKQKLLEAIGAKESFKIEVMKLITEVQNTFERLKVLIDQTTIITPPPKAPRSSSSSSSRQKIVADTKNTAAAATPAEDGLAMDELLFKRLQEVEERTKQLHATMKINQKKESTSSTSTNKIASVTESKNSSKSAEKSDFDEMLNIENEIRKYVSKYQSSNILKDTIKQEPVSTPNNSSKKNTKKVIEMENRRCSKRLQSNVSVKKLSPTDKENIEKECGFKEITNNTRNPLQKPKNQRGLKLIETPQIARGRKRRIIV